MTLKQLVKNFAAALSYQTLVIAILAVASTYLCLEYGFAAKMPTGLISVAIIFPIVFSINAAYKRREEALKYFASMKAHCIALYLAHRDWVPEADEDARTNAKDLSLSLLTAIRDYFQAGNDEEEKNVQRYYGICSRYSQSLENLRALGVPANEVSRANQYLSKIMVEFERMKNILKYRTPLLLRAYSMVFLNTFPILFGPFFAWVCKEYYPLVGYATAIIYTMVLVSLDNIQEHLEDPYDGTCADDVDLDIIHIYDKVMTKQ